MKLITANLFLSFVLTTLLCCTGVVENATLWGYRSTPTGPYVGNFDDKGNWFPVYEIPRCCNASPRDRVLAYNSQEKIFYFGRHDILTKEALLVILRDRTDVTTITLTLPTPNCSLWQLFYEPIRKFLYGFSQTNGTGYFFRVDPLTGGTSLITKFAFKSANQEGCYSTAEIGGAQYFSSTNTVYLYYEPYYHPSGNEIEVIELDIDNGNIKDRWSYTKSYLPDPIITGTKIDELALTSITVMNNQDRGLVEIPLRDKGATAILKDTYWVRTLTTNVAATDGNNVYSASLEVPAGTDHLVSLSVNNATTLSVSIPSYIFLSSLIYV